MKRLIEALINKFLCCHEYEIIHKTEYVNCTGILLRCTKCGKLKVKRV